MSYVYVVVRTDTADFTQQTEGIFGDPITAAAFAEEVRADYDYPGIGVSVDIETWELNKRDGKIDQPGGTTP